jgi:hypothetical protein
VTCCDSLQSRAAPGNAPPVRRTRRRLAGPSPARRSPRHRSGVPSTHVEAAFTGPRPRAHRRLKKDVTVYRLVSKGTIEERILERQRAKQNLADEVIGADAAGFKDLTKEELMGLFQLDSGDQNGL